jgi:hypothetical protein
MAIIWERREDLSKCVWRASNTGKLHACPNGDSHRAVCGKLLSFGTLVRKHLPEIGDRCVGCWSYLKRRKRK